MIDHPERLFYYRLAALLGMTVHELLLKLSRQELIGWMAYYAIEPFGGRVEDYRFGVIGSLIASTKNHRVTPQKLFPPHTKYERDLELVKEIDRVFMSMPNVKIVTDQ